MIRKQILQNIQRLCDKLSTANPFESAKISERILKLAMKL